MTQKLKILLVDDEESIKRVVEQVLSKDGYNLLYAADGNEGWQKFRKEQPDLVILDIMLPEKDGFEVCTLIRREFETPIIMLSAKGDIVDKSVGFNLGADDYLTKPFSPVELSLRVKALIRRSINLNKDKNQENIYHNKQLAINEKRREVVVRGEKADLTPKEFDLLSFLAKHPGQVFTREQLFKNLWLEDYISDPGTITVLIRKIRTKIENDPAKPEILQTVWGVGYKFMEI
ncbi:MAG: response regulator transcription factor [Bacillota bacterium]|nr:response regulator transcription factor [Bacillota bacterium]